MKPRVLILLIALSACTTSERVAVELTPDQAKAFSDNPEKLQYMKSCVTRGWNTFHYCLNEYYRSQASRVITR